MFSQTKDYFATTYFQQYFHCVLTSLMHIDISFLKKYTRASKTMLTKHVRQHTFLNPKREKWICLSFNKFYLSIDSGNIRYYDMIYILRLVNNQSETSRVNSIRWMTLCTLNSYPWCIHKHNHTRTHMHH